MGGSDVAVGLFKAVLSRGKGGGGLGGKGGELGGGAGRGIVEDRDPGLRLEVRGRLYTE